MARTWFITGTSRGFGREWAEAAHATPLPTYEKVRELAAEGRRRRVSKPGDPAATRAAILKIVDAENPPLRVFFGEVPLGIATADYESRLAEWREWQPIAIEAQGDA